MANTLVSSKERHISLTVSVPAWVTDVFSENSDIDKNALLIIEAKKLAEERKQFNLLPNKPLPNDFVKNNNIARTMPPFTPVMETKQDVDGRVVGHGFVARITCLSPDKNKEINNWIDSCEA